MSQRGGRGYWGGGVATVLKSGGGQG
jgi:hypothetical protein